MRYLGSRQHRSRISINRLRRPLQMIGMTLLLIVLLGLAGNGRAATGESQQFSYDKALNFIGLENILAQREFQAGFTAYQREEYILARRHWEPIARQGHALSQFYMGMLHDANNGIMPQSRVAFEWYALAASQGIPEAQQKLAQAYAKGNGVVRNLRQALDWWLRAARQGNADSQYNLGVIYAVGGEKVPRDIGKAAHWWRQAAIGGDPMAQYNLGALYANGDTGKPDLCEAIHWWRKSKQNGFKQAHAALHLVEGQVDALLCQTNR